MVCFNTRSPCGERLRAAPYAETYTLFQHTLPEWGATRSAAPSRPCPGVSTHAPRVGSDCYLQSPTRLGWRFNSRSPSGERLTAGLTYRRARRFNSRSPSGERRKLPTPSHDGTGFQLTLPERGATAEGSLPLRARAVSTHAPRAGSDLRW